MDGETCSTSKILGHQPRRRQRCEEVRKARETGRMRFQSRETRDSHNVVVEPVVEPKEKTPDGMRVGSEEE